MKNIFLYIFFFYSLLFLNLNASENWSKYLSKEWAQLEKTSGTAGKKLLDERLKDIKDFWNNYNPKDCEGNLISGGGLEQFLGLADCEYTLLTSTLKRNNLLVKGVDDAAYDYYKNFNTLLQNIYLGLNNAWSRKEKERVVTEWVRREDQLKDRFRKEFTQSIVEYTKQDISYLKASQKAKKPKEASGTAFFINDTGHLLTNHHVVDGCKVSKIKFNNREYVTKLISTDATLDLALLKVNLKPKNYITFTNDFPKKLDKIFVAGFPFGKGLSDDLKITSGIISSLKGYKNNSNEIQIDAAINLGNSGGPIVNEDGELVAVAVSGFSKKLSEGINFGIKKSSVESFLSTNEINAGSSSLLNFSFSNNKLLNVLEKSTVYTFCKLK